MKKIITLETLSRFLYNCRKIFIERQEVESSDIKYFETIAEYNAAKASFTGNEVCYIRETGAVVYEHYLPND